MSTDVQAFSFCLNVSEGTDLVPTPVTDGFTKGDDYSIGDACAVNARKLAREPIGLRIANMQCHLSSSKAADLYIKIEVILKKC